MTTGHAFPKQRDVGVNTSTVEIEESSSIEIKKKQKNTMKLFDAAIPSAVVCLIGIAVICGGGGYNYDSSHVGIVVVHAFHHLHPQHHHHGGKITTRRHFRHHTQRKESEESSTWKIELLSRRSRSDRMGRLYLHRCHQVDDDGINDGPKVMNSKFLSYSSSPSLAGGQEDNKAEGVDQQGAQPTKQPPPPASSSSSSSSSPTSWTAQRRHSNNFLSRRNLIVSSMAGLSAEMAWRQAVDTAYTNMFGFGAGDDARSKSMGSGVGGHSGGFVANAAAAGEGFNLLPKKAIEDLQIGRAVVIPNWLSSYEVDELRTDCQACYNDGHFTNFVYSKDNSKKGQEDFDPKFMPSFYPRKKKDEERDGPFVNPDIGNVVVRNNIKARMAVIKAQLSKELHDTRPTLADDLYQTHEMEYIYYNAGGHLKRHVDERHIELKRPMGAQYSLKPNATRRSITWLIYLNYDDWDPNVHGGHLRVYERKHLSHGLVGANGKDLQIGWLSGDGGTTSSSSGGDVPIFLDPLHPMVNKDGEKTVINPKESCRLYYLTSNNNNNLDHRVYLSEKPFPNVALYVAGGESMMIDDPNQLQNFHRIDTTKSKFSSMLSSTTNEEEESSEAPRDIVPSAGTLVLFDSVSLPHQVLTTNRERFGVQGWFHEKLFSYV